MCICLLYQFFNIQNKTFSRFSLFLCYSLLFLMKFKTSSSSMLIFFTPGDGINTASSMHHDNNQFSTTDHYSQQQQQQQHYGVPQRSYAGNSVVPIQQHQQGQLFQLGLEFESFKAGFSYDGSISQSREQLKRASVVDLTNESPLPLG